MPAYDIRDEFDVSTLGRQNPAPVRMRDTAPVLGAVSSADAIEPTVTVVSPAEGTPITPDTPLVVDVEDEDTLRYVRLFASFAGATSSEVVYDGDDFLAPYAGGGATPSSSVAVLIAGRSLRFTLRRVGGWPGAVSLNVAPIDGGGNIPTA